MELVGKLKEQVENSSNIEEAKKLIEKAGMILSDEELLQVSGGSDQHDEIQKKMRDIKRQIDNEKNPTKRKKLIEQYFELAEQDMALPSQWWPLGNLQ